MHKRIGQKADAVKRHFEKARIVHRKVLDEVKFVRSWVESPLKTGAISPSGPALAEKMASFITPRPHSRVVELGPGTGVVTKALFERGLASPQLNLIEFNPDFCDLLRHRYPGLHVIEGDAYTLTATLNRMARFGNAAFDNSQGLDGIVSSLPLLTRPEEAREALLEEALSLLKPGAPFIQFSYGLSAPVRANSARVSLTCSDWVWKNLPPARVWIYRKSN